MTLPADEFIRRFLLHVLPDGFHRIRHYGLFATSRRAATIARIRRSSRRRGRSARAKPTQRLAPSRRAARETSACPCCGGRMIIVERFAPGAAPRTIRRRQDRHLMIVTPRLAPRSAPMRAVSARDAGPAVPSCPIADLEIRAQVRITVATRSPTTAHRRQPEAPSIAPPLPTAAHASQTQASAKSP